MYVIQLIVLVVLVAIASAALTLLWCVVRGATKRRLLVEARGALCDAADGAGISVLCSSIGDVPQLGNLLDVGYGRYEVVLVADAVRHPEAFAALTARFCLIKVNHTLSEELPEPGVRGLYRSRKRCFRRLVAVDKDFTTVVADLNAAVSVATYDYLFPMRSEWRLMPHAIGRMATELGESPLGAIDQMVSLLGVPAMLFRREVVVAAGGFGHKPWRGVTRSRRRVLYEPLLMPNATYSDTGIRWGLLLAPTLTFGVVYTAVAGWWMLCAMLLTMIMIWCVMLVVAPMITRNTGYAIGSFSPAELLRRKFDIKNFTIS